jgi:hypothetical protein|tara:strand:+ start:26847 stop:27554 length:708 start_codon:yes stop_codon:yes gene_type:complete
MVDENAEDITNPADENQDDTSDNKDVTSPADDTLLSDEDAANTDSAAEAEDANGDDADGDGEAEPVSYDDLVMPDGMELDENMLGEFKGIAAEMNDGKGLSKDDAQKLVDFRAKTVKEATGEWETKFSEWRGELLSDKEIGGDKFKESTVPNVLAAAERYGDKDMLALLQTNKMYGENPSLIRMLNRVGETLRADQHVRGRAAQPGDEESKLRRMYPSHYNEDGSTKDRHKGSTS